MPEVEVDLNLDAYLPTEYITNEQAKIEIYKNYVKQKHMSKSWILKMS